MKTCFQFVKNRFWLAALALSGPFAPTTPVHAQAVLWHSAGANVSVAANAELTVQGGVALGAGSALTLNGTLRLQSNEAPSVYLVNAGASPLTVAGGGRVVFNTAKPLVLTGPALSVSRLTVAGTGTVTLNAPLTVRDELTLAQGVVQTGSHRLELLNPATDALTGGGPTAYVAGTLRRYLGIHDDDGGDAYDFPVGRPDGGLRRLTLLNKTLRGVAYLDASFGPKNGGDAGMTVGKNGVMDASVHGEGVWALVPNAPPTGGKFGLKVSLKGFEGLNDNGFTLLRRPVGASDADEWRAPVGSTVPNSEQVGRTVAAGFAWRTDLADFGEFGIGQSGGTSRLAEPLRSLRAWPNPTDAVLTAEYVSTAQGEATLALLTATGQTAWQEQRAVQPGSNQWEFSLGSLPPGLYMLRVTDSAGAVPLAERVVKR